MKTSSNQPIHRENLLKKRIKAFGFAFSGLKNGFLRELPLKIHFAALLLVIAAGLIYRIGSIEWLLLLGSCGFVIIMELVNTALEQLCDLVSENFSPGIKYIKDLAAAAVLVAVILALAAGYVVFWPRMIM